MRARAIARELPGNAAAARSALKRELDRVAVQGIERSGLPRKRNAVEFEPGVDCGEVVVLAEGIERNPQSKALGKRDLLLDRFARMDFLAEVPRFQVLTEILRQQMPAVRRRVNEHVRRRRR